MVGELTRRIHFYELNCRHEDEPSNLEELFNHIGTLPFSFDGRYFELPEENAWLMYVDSNHFPIKGRIGMKRQTGLPLVEEHGETSPLEIPENAGLFEPMHFIIFRFTIDDRVYNVAGFEYNFYGPRPTSLIRYLPAKANDYLDEIKMLPLIRTNITQMMARVGELKTFSLRVHRNMDELLRGLDDNLPDAFRALKMTTDAETIEVIFKPQRHSRRTFGISFLERITEWLSDDRVRSGVDNLKIKATEVGEDYGTVEFDLLQQYLITSKQILKQDDIHRSVNTDSMYGAIREAYNENRGEITRIVHDRGVID